ncbi:MAG: hypothetical protein PF569_09015 [Candidatus Woesearchaeota archaeon]|jgi:hypothetical protein|nr:hypothetical protein [Candidatus Woesearchaeota archaeon]
MNDIIVDYLFDGFKRFAKCDSNLIGGDIILYSNGRYVQAAYESETFTLFALPSFDIISATDSLDFFIKEYVENSNNSRVKSLVSKFRV